MEGVFVGIDVGGTHTDGVAVAEGRIVHKVKVPTRSDDLRGCTLRPWAPCWRGLSPAAVRRVVLSTTLVTNAVVQGDLDPTGTLLCAGPGVDPALHAPGGDTRVVPGAVDHRGREITPLDEAAVIDAVTEFRAAGIRALAVVGKFSVRNPNHELRIAELVGDGFDAVCLGHTLSGSLNFPRRVATAYLAAGVIRHHRAFVGVMTSALAEFGVDAPLYLLRADGGTQLAQSFRNPAETALSGPAASVMGVEALDRVDQDTLALDIGGTTTDIGLFASGAPLLEPRGATIGAHRTQIRALFTRSTGAGGDSVVRVENDRLLVGPQRLGPPACLPWWCWAVSWGTRRPQPSPWSPWPGCSESPWSRPRGRCYGSSPPASPTPPVGSWQRSTPSRSTPSTNCYTATGSPPSGRWRWADRPGPWRRTLRKPWTCRYTYPTTSTWPTRWGRPWPG